MARLDLKRTLVRLLTISLPATIVCCLVLAAGLELWVRASYDPTQGTRGLFLPDVRRRMRLAPNFSGWFAGVPVRTNGLGLRDEREHRLEKGAKTYRIIVLGDSVTFGHGSLQENTYPRLLETLLRAWRPGIDWQVWNAGVPGYNTSQELAHLVELGPVARPDLVVVGFFINDLIDNFELVEPGRTALLLNDVRVFAHRHVASLDFYRRARLTLQWRLTASDAYRMRLEALEAEDQLLVRPGQIADAELQQITAYDRLTDEQIATNHCNGGGSGTGAIEAMQRDSFPRWLGAVRALQELHARGAYKIVFFLNIIPPSCPSGDLFYDGGVGVENAFFVKILGHGTPAVSAFDAFLHRRPSQMPNARSHAFGNSNMTKAETLFAYLRERQLVPSE